MIDAYHCATNCGPHGPMLNPYCGVDRDPARRRPPTGSNAGSLNIPDRLSSTESREGAGAARDRPVHFGLLVLPGQSEKSMNRRRRYQDMAQLESGLGGKIHHQSCGYLL